MSKVTLPLDNTVLYNDDPPPIWAGYDYFRIPLIPEDKSDPRQIAVYYPQNAEKALIKAADTLEYMCMAYNLDNTFHIIRAHATIRFILDFQTEPAFKVGLSDEYKTRVFSLERICEMIERLPFVHDQLLTYKGVNKRPGYDNIAIKETLKKMIKRIGYNTSQSKLDEVIRVIDQSPS